MKEYLTKNILLVIFYYMNITYTQSTFNFANDIISLGRWEFIIYLVLAFLLGFFIHYIFSSRRDYVRTSKKYHRHY